MIYSPHSINNNKTAPVKEAAVSNQREVKRDNSSATVDGSQQKVYGTRDQIN